MYGVCTVYVRCVYSVCTVYVQCTYNRCTIYVYLVSGKEALISLTSFAVQIVVVVLIHTEPQVCVTVIVLTLSYVIWYSPVERPSRLIYYIATQTEK